MKIFYDKQSDSAYIELSQEQPTGVVEVSDGVNIDTTENNKIVGIQLLDASKKFPIDTLFRFEVEQTA